MSDTKEYENGLTVLALQGENVKRVRAVKIIPPRVGVVKVAGKNGAGKSSVLDLIQMALGGGKVQPALPIRQGAAKASDVLDLQDVNGKPALRVVRKWTGKDSYLSVEKIGGGRIASPQEFLDALCGAGLGFDPLAFMRLKPRDQVDRLLAALSLTEDPRKIDEDRDAATSERALLTRETKTLRAQIEAMPSTPDGTPDEPVSIAALLAERDQLQAQRDARSEAERLARQALSQEDEAAKEVERASARVKEAEQALAKTEELLVAAERGLERRRQQAETAVAAAQALTDPDFTEIDERLRTATAVNAAVADKKTRRLAENALYVKEENARDLTQYIEQLDEKKRALLLGASFPVAGLGFEIVAGEYTPTLAGVPLDQVAQSEQIRVGVALAMALTPTVRVILVRDGSLLDADTLAEVERLSGERGYQVWTEIVGDGGSDAFLIEDGGVLRSPDDAEGR